LLAGQCPESKISIKGGIERDGIYLAIQGDRRKEAEPAVNAWLKKLNLLNNK